MARLPFSVRRNLVELMRALPPGPMDRSQSPFWRQALFGQNPQTWYHGTLKSGHTRFLPPTGGKTRNTGTFLGGEDRAYTYSGSYDEAVPYDGNELFDEPGLLDDLNINHVRGGRRDDQPDLFEDYSEEPIYAMAHPRIGQWEGTREEIVDALDDEFTGKPGIYPLIVRPGRYDSTLDWQGNNWDQGPSEKEYAVLRGPNDGSADPDYRPDLFDEVEVSWDRDEAQRLINKLREDNPNDELLLHERDGPPEYWSTDDAARQVRDTGVDTLLIQNLSDHGPHGWGDGESDTFVVFKPELMRHAGVRPRDGLPVARFDPRKRKVNDILAGLASGTITIEMLRRALLAELDDRDS